MNKVYAFLAIVFIVASANAQSSSVPSNTSAATSPATSNDDKKTGGTVKIGNVEVPIEKTRPVTVPKFATPITVDGKIDEDAWKNAVVFKDFYQTSPGDNIAASKPTEVLMMYDEKNLYVAFKCWDEKDKIRASVARRDNVFGEDNVRMWLDTYNDQRRAYVLGFNPYGVQQDGMYTEGQGADFSVDIVMESKGVIEDWGWVVEVKVPFKSLRYSAGKGKFWGFNAARNIDRLNDEFNQWLPDDRNVNGFLIKHGKITGLDDIKYERTLEIVPSITVSETGRRFAANDPITGRFVNQPVKQDIGVTLKYSISPNISLDAAINPDFAEIEADAPVVTANQRFPIFFQEKRPFFLEGAEIFQMPLAIYHSRSIIDPDFATKLTGKIGKNSFGFMVASDKAPGNYSEDERAIASNNEFLDRNALFGIFRVKRDFGKENHIGFFGSYRSFPEQKNFVGSVDARLKLSPKMTSQMHVAVTSSRRCFFDNEFEPILDATKARRNREICGTGRYGSPLDPFDPTLNTQGNGTFNEYRTGNALGYYANLESYTDRRSWFVEIGGRTKDFRADAGFTRRTDTNFAFAMNRVATKSEPKASIIRASWAQYSGIDYDWSGRLQRWRLGNNLNMTLQRTMFLFLEAGVSYEKLYEEEFGLKRMPTRPLGRFFGEADRGTWQQYYYAELGQTLNKWISYSAWINYQNNAYDFFFPMGNGQINPGPGKQLDTQASIDFKPITPLRASVSYRKSRLVRNDNRVRAFDADIVSVRSTYQFSRFMFTRLRLDYSSMSDNYAGQLLFGWTPSPGKAFYVGYNDNFNYNGVNPFTGDLDRGFERNSRTFFIRVSYLFRKSL
ncbi:MAG TPA: DUF5916 domain-containing protein [Pyrinomonadaceae bacterium]|nr:DUF5916 domain-containing protein [Pyrinomonadaceae bacterium]